MKAILEFDLENKDDRKAHLRCVKSTEMAIILWEIQNNFFKKLNTGDKDMIYAIGIVLDRITELLDDNDININNLID